MANSGSGTATVISDTASSVITPEVFASVSVFKAADKETVVSGDTLTYTFTLMNVGAQAAESIEFVDDLPPEFTVSSVSYSQNGVTTPIAPGDYSLTPGNTLTIPAAGSALVIGVPEASETGPGTTVITVTGTIA